MPRSREFFNGRRLASTPKQDEAYIQRLVNDSEFLGEQVAILAEEIPGFSVVGLMRHLHNTGRTGEALEAKIRAALEKHPESGVDKTED